CWTTSDGFPGGYCYIEGCDDTSCPEGSSCFTFTDDVSRCIATCLDSSNCRTEHGYECDSYDTCWPGQGTVPASGPCSSAEQCAGGANAICITQEGFVDGYCIVKDCTFFCADGAECRQVFSDESFGCVALCSDDSDCRVGYICNDEPDSAWDTVCIPGCSPGDCPAPLECREEDIWSGHICKDTSSECSPENVFGDCPTGQVCSMAGECIDFECNDTVLEPNQDKASALNLPSEDTPGLQICSGDEDWFTFTPDQTDTIYQIGVAYNLASGDLENRLIDSADVVVEQSTMTRDDCLDENGYHAVNNETLAILGASGSQPYFFRVYPSGAAENNYLLLSKTVAYQDGPVCADLYSSEECRALSVAGAFDSSKLIPFPAGHPLDSYLGQNVFFLSGLTGGSGIPTFISSSRRWARRELIMMVRYAINAVEKKYPGSGPLGIGDVGLIDGHTPWGHPNNTHNDGRNVDIAYYVRQDVQREWGNMVYRQICCDNDTLPNWDCVDRNTNSPEYGTCVTDSENTHIVDIPRTAYFLAKLATSGRLRAIGIEVKIEADLDTELANLLAAQDITQQEYDDINAAMLTANDHSSWIWHFNHMHVSLCYTDCPNDKSRRLSIGPWAGVKLKEQQAYLHYWQTGDKTKLLEAKE
ncbi:MAG: hypothetical protein JRJ87_27710, partial [Deltaproteobacteria bacterium]|nr:hypothetical protein [Deltaproteobacteria bacterium]